MSAYIIVDFTSNVVEVRGAWEAHVKIHWCQQGAATSRALQVVV